MFGYAVGLNTDGNKLTVGVYDESGSSRGINGPIDGTSRGAGAAYVFTRAGDTWSREGYLKPSIAEAGDSWGIGIVLSGDGNTHAMASADEDCPATGVNPPGCVDDNTTDTSSGAVTLFVRDGIDLDGAGLLQGVEHGPRGLVWHATRLEQRR